MPAHLLRRSIVGVASVLFALATTAQPFWAPVGIHTSLVGNLFSAYNSDDGQRVYLGGGLDYELSTPEWENMLVKCSSQGLELIPVNGEIRSIVEFHDTLFIGGHFETNPAGTDTIPAYNVEFWNGTGWSTLGVFDHWGVRSLRVLDDTLYAVGSFSMVDGVMCGGMARLVNGHWQPLPPLPEPDPLGASVLDITKYDGKLIVTGPIYIDGDYVRIVYLEGDTWHPLGPGLEAGFSSIWSMTVYQNDLYVAGQIAITSNNPGRDIMRWDGSQFHKLGDVGLQRDLGDDSGVSGAGGMVEHDGLLYVGGGFRFAGGISSKGLATWDGAEWCSVPGNLSDGDGYAGARGTAFLGDTLFVICGILADTDSVNLAAKFIGESYAGPCASEVGVNDIGTIPTIAISPNPATSHIKLPPTPDPSEAIVILNAVGHVVARLAGSLTELDVSAWPRGVYLMRSANSSSRFVLQ